MNKMLSALLLSALLVNGAFAADTATNKAENKKMESKKNKKMKTEKKAKKTKKQKKYAGAEFINKTDYYVTIVLNVINGKDKKIKLDPKQTKHYNSYKDIRSASVMAYEDKSRKAADLKATAVIKEKINAKKSDKYMSTVEISKHKTTDRLLTTVHNKLRVK
ncbi:MAG: hypothetical protein SZ59_C0002G0056 [candidate division TM6 bacterium GW2011_GWF2_28_16]|nr:MAG: hypothetical protein SZ59_C0002G0056 [candidate division TM6 bacterium GW2011_GWF2_28_16]